MSDTSKATREELSTITAANVRSPVADGLPAVLTSTSEIDDVLQVLEERLTVETRRRVTGGVRVGTRTEVVDTIAEAELDRYRVEVARVPIGRIVDEVPSARAEGGVSIIPMIEERLVVVKQLFLVEEVHIRHVLEREIVTQPVTLRRQRAVIERLGDGGEAIPQGGSDAPALA